MSYTLVIVDLMLMVCWHVWLMTQSLLTDEQIASAPILILGNKIDIPGAASEDEIRHFFGLHSLTTGKVISHLEVFSALMPIFITLLLWLEILIF